MKLTPTPAAGAGALRAERAAVISDMIDGYFQGILDRAAYHLLTESGTPIGYAALTARGTIAEFYVRRGHQRRLTEFWQAATAQLRPAACLVRSDDPWMNLICHDLSLSPTPSALNFVREAQIRLDRPPGEDLDLVPLAPAHFEPALAILRQEDPQHGGHNEEDAGRMRASVGTDQYHILLSGGTVAGVGMQFPVDGRPGIKDQGMVIAAAYRRRGYAAWLMSHLASNAEAQGFRVVAGAAADNTGSRRALERAGWRVLCAWQMLSL